MLKTYNKDYKVPANLAKKLIDEYPETIVIDVDSEEIQYEDTLDAMAEKIFEDYNSDKMKRVFGYEMFSPEEISRWLQYNVPDMYELLLIMNKEL